MNCIWRRRWRHKQQKWWNYSKQFHMMSAEQVLWIIPTRYVQRILKNDFVKMKLSHAENNMKFPFQEYGVRLEGEWYRHAVSKYQTPNTQQHCTISHTNEDLNWSILKDETLIIFISQLHQHQYFTCLITLHSKPLYEMVHGVNAIRKTPHTSPWWDTTKH